jgi:hypothetical protein
VIEIEIREGLVETEVEVSEPQKVTEARKNSVSTKRPKLAASAPSTTPASDGDEGDGSDEGATND